MVEQSDAALLRTGPRVTFPPGKMSRKYEPVIVSAVALHVPGAMTNVPTKGIELAALASPAGTSTPLAINIAIPTMVPARRINASPESCAERGATDLRPLRGQRAVRVTKW
jgi:hypothetical protein